MKRVFIGMALAAFVATTACAQDQSLNASSPDRHKMRHHRGDMTAQLNLTDEQKTAMKSINEDFKQQMTDLKKSEDKITVTEWKSKMATIRKDHHEKVDKVLTTEQKANLKKMKHHGRKFRQDKHNRIDRMQKELNLTAEQRASVEKNQAEMLKEIRAVRDNKSLTDDQKKEEYRALHKKEHENLKSILTEEQLKKLEENKKQHKHYIRQQKPVQS